MILEVFADDLTKKDISKNKFYSSRAIIRKDGQVLLLHSKKLDYFMFPGGRIEKDETPKACVKREILEETGLHIKVLKETVVIKEYYQDSTWESHFFSCEVDDDIVNDVKWTEEEHYLDLELKWVPFLDALTLLDEHESTFSKAMNIMQREFLALTHSQ